MCHCPFTKIILLEAAFSFLDCQMILSRREGPQVTILVWQRSITWSFFTKVGKYGRHGTYPRANATIASHDLFEWSKPDGEPKVPTVAVAMVVFQLGCLSFFGHFEKVL